MALKFNTIEVKKEEVHMRRILLRSQGQTPQIPSKSELLLKELAISSPQIPAKSALLMEQFQEHDNL